MHPGVLRASIKHLRVRRSLSFHDDSSTGQHIRAQTYLSVGKIVLNLEDQYKRISSVKGTVNV